MQRTTGIGKWTKYVEPIAAAEGNCVTMEGKTFKAMPGWGTHFDYAVFTSGDDSVGRTVCSMACVALNAAKVYYEEKHDKGSFIKNIISDNILISDIYMRAKELHVAAEVPRGVFVIRPVDDRAEAIPVDVVQNMFPDRQNDFVLSVGDDDVALIHQMPEGACGRTWKRWPPPSRRPCGWTARAPCSWASAPWPCTCGIWPRPIRRPRSPLRWARSLTPSAMSSTMRTWASAG